MRLLRSQTHTGGQWSPTQLRISGRMLQIQPVPFHRNPSHLTELHCLPVPPIVARFVWEFNSDNVFISRSLLVLLILRPINNVLAGLHTHNTGHSGVWLLSMSGTEPSVWKSHSS